MKSIELAKSLALALVLTGGGVAFAECSTACAARQPDLLVVICAQGEDRGVIERGARGEYRAIRESAASRGAELTVVDAAADIMRDVLSRKEGSSANRVFLVGLGDCGTRALSVAAVHPNDIAGVTAFNAGVDTVTRDRPWAFLPTAVSLTVGGRDAVVLAEDVRQLARRIAAYHPGTVFIDDVPERGHETDYVSSKRALDKMFACADKLFDGTLWRGKPKTQKRYLQGPLAERLLVMTRCGSVTLGEISHRKTWSEMPYSAEEAHGIQLVAEDGEVFDYGTMDLRVGDRGIPIHGQTWHDGAVDLDLEGCAPFGQKPSANLRFRVKNRGSETTRAKASFLVRTGRENRLVFDAPDGYQFHIPNARNWHATAPVWYALAGGVLRDGERFVSYSGDLPCEWDGKSGALRIAVDLRPGEERTLDLVIGKGDAEKPAYDEARRRTIADWERELARAAKRPAFIQSMLVQMLQCFSRPTNGDFVLARQGGLQRWVWPGEQMEVAAALTILGYGEYVESTCDFYFEQYAQPGGEVGPFGNNWASDTSYVLRTFARYCRETGNAAYWRKHRDAAARAFKWMKAKRAETAGRTDCTPGLYPPMKSTDMPQVFQFWGGTDMANLEALEAYSAAAELFGDPEASAARAEVADYRAVLTAIVDRWREASAGKDTLWFPLSPDGRGEKELRDAEFFYYHPGSIASGGFLSASEMLRLRKWLLDEKYADSNGLYQRQSTNWRDPDGTHVWYTTWSELRWCAAWMRVGRRDLAEQAYRACLEFSVTEEDYVGERCCDKTPWYFPWTPNASGAGRLVQMHYFLNCDEEKR